MKNNEIIKKAQTECGEYATGYKGDISENSLMKICEMIWIRAKNLSYNFAEWHREMTVVIGIKAYRYWLDQIMDFQQSKMEACKYFCFHGQRYCA
jgi:hypothetical protein